MHIHFGNSKSTILAAATIMILMALSAVRPAFALGTVYTNSALTGCYAHHNTSVDTEPLAKNRSEVGTVCFDGAGNVVDSLGTPNLSGSCANTNGVPTCAGGNGYGVYNISNTPGDGMGTVWLYSSSSVLCQVNEISIDNVQGGLAHGFEFTVMARYAGAGCGGPSLSPKVMGGTAIYQGP